jgi:ankyrin repeat protein
MHLAAEKGKDLRLRPFLSGNVDARNPSGYTALWLASSNGHIRCVTMLLDAKADVNALSTQETTAIMIAAQGGHLDVVNALIEARADLNLVSSNHRSVLHYACQHNRHPIVAALLAAGAIIDPPGSAESTLTVTVPGNCLESLKMLIAAGGDLNGTVATALTPMITAVVCKNMKAMKMLIEAKVDVNYTPDNRSPLLGACQAGYIDMVNLLISAGANAKELGPNGHSHLHSMVDSIGPDGSWTVVEKDSNSPSSAKAMPALKCDFVACVNVLVENGIDLEARGPDGETALIIATSVGNAQAVKALLAAGADPNATTNSRESPLLSAACSGSLATVSALLEAGDDVDVNYYSEEQTATDIADDRGYTAMAAALRKAGGKPWSFCVGEMYPLVHSVFAQDAKLCIERIVDADQEEKENALRIAVITGKHAFVKALLIARVSVDITFRASGLLGLACSQGFPEVVKALLEGGADITVKNSSGKTPLQVAAANNEREIVVLLLAKAKELQGKNMKANK